MTIKRIINIFAVLTIIGIIGSIILFIQLAPHIPRLPDQLSILADAPATEVYDRNGDLIRSLGGKVYVSIDRISPYFLNAVIAAEDKRFYNHHGIDHIATIRSIYLNLLAMGKGPGGSTITQQLAKNLFFKFHRSWKRKVLEASAAMAIENRFTKEQILETYCNLIYFGPYSYGIERAATIYFGKHASDLDLHESALIAGILNSPGYFDPYNHFDRAKNRQKLILHRMASSGMIQPEIIDSVSNVPLTLLQRRPSNARGSFPIDYSLQIAREAIGKDIVNYGGVTISTTLDPALQLMAQQAITKGLTALENRLQPLPEDANTRLEGALVAIEVASGDIRALVGGRNYAESEYNRAIYSRRQPGSSFKPVVYLTALEQLDINPATVYIDSLMSYKIDRRKTWKPPNYGRTYQGPVILKYALMRSINTVAAQLIFQVKPDLVIRTAQRLGLKTELEPHLSLALGAQGIPPIEMASMFATIANQGIAVEPHLVRRIDERGGEVLYERLSVRETRFSEETIAILVDMLSGVLDGGTGSAIRSKGFRGVAFGKTGTTDDYRDAWFVGSTPSLAVAVWIGYDDFRPMRYKSETGKGQGVTGGGGAAPIWADFMISATAGTPSRTFRTPPNITHAFADKNSGYISEEKMDNSIPVALLESDLLSMLEQQALQIIAPIDTSMNELP